MKYFGHNALTAVLVTVLAGCASAPPLSEAGARVRAVTAEQAKQCKFVKTVQYTDRILGMGKDPTVMRAIGETNLRNEVGLTGANAFVVTKNDSNWFLGNVDYQAEAFTCPS
ncbi:hypothetical protein OOT46_21630 [Aquabacterium sp. A7-Y]|uniref:hypothetical protein n=1 Tax=Aquabacterium sp. A7-Y TaxID=1349605 RepID=UPI00223CEE4E|nr:hypothetical protein [Aquabacterium sp. A7-Y]MCW7540433.1 hypothetical protein [Aquabacterium sp. A7-Y]